MSTDYYVRISNAATRQEAADLILASAARHIARCPIRPADAFDLATQADRRAEQLLRDVQPDPDSDALAEPPWRQWLVEWGYVVHPFAHEDEDRF